VPLKSKFLQLGESLLDLGPPIRENVATDWWTAAYEDGHGGHCCHWLRVAFVAPGSNAPGLEPDGLLLRVARHVDFRGDRLAAALSAIAMPPQVADVTAVKALPLLPILAVALIEKLSSFRRAGLGWGDKGRTASRRTRRPVCVPRGGGV